MRLATLRTADKVNRNDMTNLPHGNSNQNPNATETKVVLDRELHSLGAKTLYDIVRIMILLIGKLNQIRLKNLTTPKNLTFLQRFIGLGRKLFSQFEINTKMSFESE